MADQLRTRPSDVWTGLGPRALAAIDASLAPSTRQRYDAEWSAFCRACPSDCTPELVAEYLAGLSYNRARVARSAISFFAGPSATDSPLISRVLKGLFRNAAPAKRSIDPSLLRRIVSELRSWGPVEGLSRERLLTRSMIIFRLASWARASDVDRVARKDVHFLENGVRFTVRRPKQARPSAPDHTAFVAGHADETIDVVRHLRCLFSREGSAKLFPEGLEDIKNRAKKFLRSLGSDENSHTLRHMGASAAFALGFPIDAICAHAGWASASTALKYYAQAWTSLGQAKPPHISLAAFV